MKVKTVFLVASVVLIGSPLAIVVATGLLTIFDPNDQWKIPGTADLALALILFLCGLVCLRRYLKERVKEKVVSRIMWDSQDTGHHSGLRRR